MALVSGPAIREHEPPLTVRTTLLVPTTVLKFGVVKFAAKALGIGLTIPMKRLRLAMEMKSLLSRRVFTFSKRISFSPKVNSYGMNLKLISAISHSDFISMRNSRSSI